MENQNENDQASFQNQLESQFRLAPLEKLCAPYVLQYVREILHLFVQYQLMQTLHYQFQKILEEHDHDAQKYLVRSFITKR